MQKFFAIAQDFSGNIVPNATITVYNAGTLVLSAIYSDNISTPKLNPFISDDDGTFEYYAANGRYDTIVTKAGFTFDPENTADCLLDDPSSTSAYGNVRLGYISPTQLKLSPHNGLLLGVPSADGTNLRTRAIPGGGITANNTNVMVNQVAGQNLGASTVYFVYIRDTGAGTLIPNFSTTGHGTDTVTGVEHRTGGAMDTLVGMARTNASSQFTDTPAARFVLSWFNRQRKPLLKQMAPADVLSGSGAYIELAPATDRAEFLVWADGVGLLTASGGMFNDSLGETSLLQVALDGAGTPGSASAMQAWANNAGYTNTASLWMSETGVAITEGYHYGAPMGRTKGGVGTWVGGSGENSVYIRGFIDG